MKVTICLALLAAGITVGPAPARAAGPEILNTECIHIVAKKVKASAPCTVKVYATASSATEQWDWENGTRTVVKMSDEGIVINDQAAEEADASDIIDVEVQCHRIIATGEIYCSGK